MKKKLQEFLVFWYKVLLLGIFAFAYFLMWWGIDMLLKI